MSSPIEQGERYTLWRCSNRECWFHDNSLTTTVPVSPCSYCQSKHDCIEVCPVSELQQEREAREAAEEKLKLKGIADWSLAHDPDFPPPIWYDDALEKHQRQLDSALERVEGLTGALKRISKNAPESGCLWPSSFLDGKTCSQAKRPEEDWCSPCIANVALEGFGKNE